MLRRFLFCVATLWSLCDANPAISQPVLINPTAPTALITPEPTKAAPPLADKRADNAEQLRLAMRKLEAGGAADSAAAQEVAFYQTREAVLAQEEIVEQQIKDLEARKAELDAQLKSPSPNVKSEECTFAALDRLKDELAAEQSRVNLLSDKLAASKAAVVKTQATLEENEVKRRQAQETFEKAKEGQDNKALSLAAEQARQASALSIETLTLKKREVVRDTLAQEVQRMAVQVCRDRVSRMSPLVAFTEADFQKQIADITKNETTANKNLAKRQAELHDVTRALQEAQKEYDTATGDRTVLAEKLEAQRCSRVKISDEIDSITYRLQRYAQLRLAWTNRYKIASLNGGEPDKQSFDELKELQEETRSTLDELAADLRIQILRMRDIRTSLTNVTKKADAAATAPEGAAQWLQMQQGQLEATLKTLEKNLVTIETSRRIHEKLLDEIGLGVEALTPKTLALGAWRQAELIWKYEITQLNDRSVRIGMVVKGLIVLILGWMLSRFMSVLLANRLLKRFRLSKDSTSTIRSLVFYGMLAMVVLSALNTVNVPLTAFTILGGALAIGVGFGSQALINNFIGGLIMLAERPVRLGEKITFGNFDGEVEDVGFRCTKLRTQNDHLVTIPNSTLVNESIENIDRRRTIRRQFTVAISYNVTRDMIATAVQAIRDVLEEREIRERIHPIVGFEEFSPRVYFTDFATESLNIQITYWYAPVDSWAFMEHAERVNLRIMETLDRIGVEFAFPSKTAYVKNVKKQIGRGTDAHAA